MSGTYDPAMQRNYISQPRNVVFSKLEVQTDGNTGALIITYTIFGGFLIRVII